MNTNPDAITILCYGDSNTYGTKTDRSGRYATDERWTGLLQRQLGGKYYIIEEGLGGRTTDLDHYNPNKPSRNGLTYFKACVDSHMPLDIIIIMLGTNDLKTIYNRSAEDIATVLQQYLAYVKQYCEERGLKQSKIILISPAYMNESMPSPGIYDEGSVEKSHQLASAFKQVAESTGNLFFDAASVAQAGEDGCHLNKESHEHLANALAKLISGFSE
jgi:lysophospholipase L1-like esterase